MQEETLEENMHEEVVQLKLPKSEVAVLSGPFRGETARARSSSSAEACTLWNLTWFRGWRPTFFTLLYNV